MPLKTRRLNTSVLCERDGSREQSIKPKGASKFLNSVHLVATTFIYIMSSTTARRSGRLKLKPKVIQRQEKQELPKIAEEEPIWEYRRLVARRVPEGSRDIQYLVDWMPTWEWAKELANIDEAVRDYELRRSGQTAESTPWKEQVASLMVFVTLEDRYNAVRRLAETLRRQIGVAPPVIHTESDDDVASYGDDERFNIDDPSVSFSGSSTSLDPQRDEDWIDEW